MKLRTLAPLLLTLLAFSPACREAEAGVSVNNSPSSSAVAKLATVPTGAALLGKYTTSLIDFTVPGFYSINTPLISGKLLHVWLFRILILNKTGTATGSLVYRWSQNGTGLDLAASSLSAAVLNGNPVPFSQAPQPGIVEPTMTTYPLQFDLITAPTGVTAMTGYAEIMGEYL